MIRETDEPSGLPPPRPEICGVMVTYHAEEMTLRSSVRAASSQLHRLIVVDNSIDPAAQRIVDQVVREATATLDGQRPMIAERRGNVGLSKALNAGLMRGLEEGHQLFLLLDQDSVLEPGAAAVLVDSYARLAPPSKTVELAARNLEEAPSQFQSLLEQVFYRSARAGNSVPRRCALAMTSGLLLPAAVLRKTGFFDESLFLDAVDHEFCLRSGSHGIALYLVPAAVIRHSLGRPVRSTWGPLSFELREADEWRLYYSTRDTLRTVRRHWRVRPFVCGTLLGFVGARAIVYGLVRGKEPRWFRAIVRGFADSVRTKDHPAIPRVR